MSICINPNCTDPLNHDTLLFCQACHSELLMDARYRVIRQLGGGGFGKTYEVRDSTLYNSPSEPTDLKVLKVLTHNHPKYIELFGREAHFLAQMNDPGVPRVESDAYFVFQPPNGTEMVHCLVMEKIEGLDLKQYIVQRGAGINQKRAVQWLMQLARILGEIHKRNFFHRDIKPSNIMLRSNGQLVLIDFGTARELTKTYLSKQDAGQLTGLFSAGYSPLEQLNGQAILQSDFFALGRTIVYLLTGKNPSDLYDPRQNKLLWRQAVPNISDEFANFLDSLMADSSADRPASAEVILGELTKIYHHLFKNDNSVSLLFDGESPIEVKTENPQEMNLVDPDATLLAAPRVSQSQVSPPLFVPLPVPAIPIPPEPPVAPPDSIDPRFIDRCQRELTEIVGPMAAILCRRALAKEPARSSEELVRLLARSIPDPAMAREFQKRLLD